MENTNLDIDQQLESKLEMFRLFGTLGSRKQRKYLCQYLDGIAKGKKANAKPFVMKGELAWLYQIVIDVLQTPGVDEQLKKHDRLRKEVVLDLISFLEEQIKLRSSSSSFSKSKKGTPKKAKNKVSNFFSSLVQKFTKSQKHKGQENGKQQKANKLHKKMEKFLKLEKMLAPFTANQSKLIGKSKGVWKNTGFNVLEHYDELLESEQELQELANLLGRFRKEEQNLADKELEDNHEESVQISSFRKEEVVGVYESDELSYVLPIELSLLSKEKTSAIFFQKYAEKKLQTFHLVGEDRVKVKKENTEQKKANGGDERKGPIIICVDTSASMWGIAEKTAKVLCFGLLKVALRENRECYLISFSKEIETIELTQFQNSLAELIAFLKMSFAGGTETSKAIRKSLELLSQKKYQSADVLLLTDGDMPQLEPKLSLEIRNKRDQGYFFFQIIFGHETNAKCLKSFDQHLFYHPGKKDNLKKIVNDLKNFTRN